MIRHCSNTELQSKQCTCLTCINTKCIVSYGKLCLLCNHITVDRLTKYYSGKHVVDKLDCPEHYSWTDKVKNKNLPDVSEKQTSNYKSMKLLYLKH